MRRRRSSREHHAIENDLQIADVGAGGTGANQIADPIEERVRVVVVEIASGARARPRRPAQMLCESTMAPAASVGPSMPSVPTLAAATSRAERGRATAPSRMRTPDCGRPCRLPVTVTVVSPGGNHARPAAAALAMRAATSRHVLPARASRASPVTGSCDDMHVIAERFGRTSRAVDRAALRADHPCRGARQPRVADRRRLRHVARGARDADDRPPLPDRSRARRGASSTSSASANVLSSAHGRSRRDDRQVVADDVGHRQRQHRPRAASASCPPLIAERCLRTVFSS